MNVNELNIPYFKFLISPIDGEKVNEIFEKEVDGVIHYLKVNNDEWSSIIIKKGAHLFNYKSPLAALEDDNFDIEDESNIHTLDNLHTLKQENDDYFALSDGILVRYDNFIKFIPITSNGTCEIVVSENKNIATAKFYPALNDGKELSKSNVIQLIKRKGILVKLGLNTYLTLNVKQDQLSTRMETVITIILI